MTGRWAAHSDKSDEAGQDIPAVANVRISTDPQKYSTENQLDIIRDYATARGLQILRVFEDSGRSGLRLDGREALQNLMAEVRTGQADFKTILVYDVSRWGRFQDADEGERHYRYVEINRALRQSHPCIVAKILDGTQGRSMSGSISASPSGCRTGVTSSAPFFHSLFMVAPKTLTASGTSHFGASGSAT